MNILPVLRISVGEPEHEFWVIDYALPAFIKEARDMETPDARMILVAAHHLPTGSWAAYGGIAHMEDFDLVEWHLIRRQGDKLDEEFARRLFPMAEGWKWRP